MEKLDYEQLEMIAYEAFIRRASVINSPFMLKGSYVTRQYFQDPGQRIPADLDWMYMHKITNHLVANQLFSDWATAVTELDAGDGVRFRSFSENDFWRKIDYAMADDFPTVNTDLTCWVDDIEINLPMDISFNLDLEQPPVSLEYRPMRGKGFTVPNTVPLSLQVSWKIHQTLVRPRFKDLFDLIHLVNHAAFDEQELAKSFQALLHECKVDQVDLSKLRSFLNYRIGDLFPGSTLDDTWEYWRHGRRTQDPEGYFISYDKASDITNADKIAYDLPTFLNHFRESMEKKGWTPDLIKDMDIPPVKAETSAKEVTPIPESVTKPADNQEPEVKSENQHQNGFSDHEAVKTTSLWERIKRMFR